MQMQLFYLQQSYLENERELVCLAAIFIACKATIQRYNLDEFIIIYYRLKNQNTQGKPSLPITDQQKLDFKTRFFAIECKVLRTLDFKLDMELNNPNTFHTPLFSQILYNHMNGSEKWQPIFKLAEAICNDSLFTYVNVLYSKQTVALSSVILAATRLKYQIPFQ